MKIKNWSEFQHYKLRSPPWIRFYRRLLDDPEWFALDGDASKMLANCWLLASERKGELPDIRTIAFRLRMAEEAVITQLSKLGHWVEGDASTLLAPRPHAASPYTDNTDNSETDNSEREARTKRARATRLEKDWWPNEANIQYALHHGLSLDRVSTESEKFRNYWTAKAGQNATKFDWGATWQNWVLKAAEQNGDGRGQQETFEQRIKRLADKAREIERTEGDRRKDDPFRGH